ncbi:MAG TPA: DUF5655 domain-containing protein [Fimbriimonadaceae bacterium]|nr:DUF5655 domain-containing protein [Fimbriimonadaceae bacterium]
MVKPGSIYSPHPGLGMVGRSRQNLLERTGSSLEDWVERLRQEGPEDPKAQAAWLKEHGITTNYAQWIVDEAAGNGPESYDPDALAEAQYAGKKGTLHPIYDRLLAVAFELGPDVKACPCATFVPLYRKNVFAQIKATTNTRIDLGLCLRGVEPSGRLLSTGGEAKGDRITHRIPISTEEEIDGEVRSWLRRAYEAAQ